MVAVAVPAALPAAPPADFASFTDVDVRASLREDRFTRPSVEDLTEQAPFACALMLMAYLSMAVGLVTATPGAAVLICGTAWGTLFSTAFLRQEGVGQALAMLLAAAASLALACVGLTML